MTPLPMTEAEIAEARAACKREAERSGWMPIEARWLATLDAKEAELAELRLLCDAYPELQARR